MKKILIVGGGTAGLIAALLLKKRFSYLTVDLVKSDEIGIIGVGEGSTEHWKEFMDFMEISFSELIYETDATFKFGIYFKDWTKNPYFHNVIPKVNNFRVGQYLLGYAYSIINNIPPEEYTLKSVFKGRTSVGETPFQFHFNTFKLNSFLLKKCKEININIFEDKITKINVENNKITFIESINKKYEYDFYVDSTGFKKILISKLNCKWISYNKFLPMNEAIAFPTKNKNHYPAYTLSKAMSAGWMWRIPTNDRWGNGYVFNNQYIDAEGAKKECETYLNTKIKIGKNIKFDAGTLENPWIGNCLAVGLSSSFIEPLEATSIGTTINQCFLALNYIINYNDKDVEQYNKHYRAIVENTRDFVVLHYLVDKKDSNFWKNLKINIPDSLKINLEKWKHRLPIHEDFKERYLLFYENNFTIILKELNLLNINVLKKEFNLLSDFHKNRIHVQFLRLKELNKDTQNWRSHKEIIKNIRNNYENNKKFVG